MRQTSAMLDQSHYVNQLVCAVGGVLVFVAKSEWRGGEQKKWKKWNLTCLHIVKWIIQVARMMKYVN